MQTYPLRPFPELSRSPATIPEALDRTLANLEQSQRDVKANILHLALPLPPASASATPAPGTQTALLRGLRTFHSPHAPKPLAPKPIPLPASNPHTPLMSSSSSSGRRDSFSGRGELAAGRDPWARRDDFPGRGREGWKEGREMVLVVEEAVLRAETHERAAGHAVEKYRALKKGIEARGAGVAGESGSGSGVGTGESGREGGKESRTEYDASRDPRLRR